MEPFNRIATRNTPDIFIDYQLGKIVIKGVSHPENALAFYAPVFNAIKRFNAEATDVIVLELQLHYFNTSSARCIFLLLKEMKTLNEDGKKIQVNWYCDEDDLDMVETGKDFEELIEIEINFIFIDPAE